MEAGPSQSGRVRAERFGLKVGSRGHNRRCPGQGECTGRCRDPGRQRLRRSAAGQAPAPPGRRRGRPPPPKPPSAENVGSRRSRFWRYLRLPSSRESPPRRRGRLRPTSLPPPSPFPSFPRAARPLLPPLSFPHPVCVPLPLRLAGRLGRPRPEREAGAQAAAATRGCGGERDPRPRGGPASGPGTRGLPLHPQPRAAGPGLVAGWSR